MLRLYLLLRAIPEKHRYPGGTALLFSSRGGPKSGEKGSRGGCMFFKIGSIGGWAK